MTPADMARAIRNGDVDSELSIVSEALRARREYLSRQKAAENALAMPAGTRVILIAPLRPKYLVDLLGKVGTGEYTPGFIWVDVDDRFRHRLGRYGTHIHVPANCLRLAGEDEE